MATISATFARTIGSSDSSAGWRRHKGTWDMGYGTWYMDMDMDMDCAGNASHSRPVDSTLRAIVYLCVWHLHYPICLSINSSPRWGVEMPNCCFHFATNLRNYISSRNICMYAGDPGARFLNSFLGGSSFQLYGQTWASTFIYGHQKKFHTPRRPCRVNYVYAMPFA